jgi:hypothetical protein
MQDVHVAGTLAVRIKRALHLQRPDVPPLREDGLRAARAEPEFELRYPAGIGATRRGGRYNAQLSYRIHGLPPTRVLPCLRDTPVDCPQSVTDANREQQPSWTHAHERMNDVGQQAAIMLMTGVRLRHRHNQQRTKQKKTPASFSHRYFPPL